MRGSVKRFLGVVSTLSLVQKVCLVALVLAAFFYISSAVVGGFTHFSPVPYWDMWYGYLAFIDHLEADLFSGWFAQHNEHRIFLSRLLFLVDYHVFGGAFVFLIILNYIIPLLTLAVLWLLYREIAGVQRGTVGFYALWMPIVCLVFSWVQKENFTWAFQSQFFLAQCVPLAALYFLFRATQEGASSVVFFISCLFGALSSVTMGSGLLILPVMTISALLLGFGKKHVLVLSIITIMVWGFYFHGFQAVASHSSLSHSILTRPHHVAAYVLIFLGAGLKRILPFTLPVAVLGFFGLSVCSLMAFYLYRFFSLWRRNKASLIIIAYVFFALFSACAIGASRVTFGFSQATVSRYTTISLMIWAALILLLSPVVVRWINDRPLRMAYLLFVPFLLIRPQLSAFQPDILKMHQRNVAALALELGVADERRIGIIANDVMGVRALSGRLRRKNSTVFGTSWLRDSFESIGTRYDLSGQDAVSLTASESVRLDDDNVYVRISGSVPSFTGPDIQRFYLVSQENIVAGVAISMPKSLCSDSSFRKIEGYVKKSAVDSVVALRDIDDSQ